MIMKFDKRNEKTKKVGPIEKLKSWRIVEDYGFRTVVLAIVSLFIGIFFALMHTVYALVYDSAWFALLATHYLVLSVLRIAILFIRHSSQERYADNPKRKRLANARTYALTGIAILVIAGIFAFAVIQISLVQEPPLHGMAVAILSAAYVTFKVTMGIINAVRAKKFHDPVKTIRNVDLIDGIVALFILETTLIGTFGAITEMRLLLAISGAAACAFTVYLGIYMLIRGHLRVKKFKAEIDAQEAANFAIAPQISPDEAVAEGNLTAVGEAATKDFAATTDGDED